MSSLLTNTSAMVALQTLRSINTSLEQTNNRVSTGLRVNNAADNAAYWSIATTIKSDNGALSAVTDSLSLGASTLSTTYTGLDTTITSLNDLKNQLVTATGANVDKTKIQDTIKSIQDQMQSVADGASFSGQNWLSTTNTGNQSIVSSVYRDSTNQLQVGTIDVNITNIRLYAAGAGILDKTIDLNTYTATGANTAVVDGSGVALTANDSITFSISKNGDPGTVVTIDQNTLTEAGLGSTIYSNADLQAVYTQALSDAGISGVSVAVDTSGNVSFSSLDNITVGAASNGNTVDTTPAAVADLGLNAVADGAFTTGAASAGAASVSGITLTESTTSATIQGYLKVVDQALSEATDAASAIGAYQNRVTSQQNFVKALSDANTTAVGALVDANMEEESTKLKALQTQQQLAVQSLSIANASTQNILTLFR